MHRRIQFWTFSSMNIERNISVETGYIEPKPIQQLNMGQLDIQDSFLSIVVSLQWRVYLNRFPSFKGGFITIEQVWAKWFLVLFSCRQRAAGFNYFPSYRYAEQSTGKLWILMGINQSPIEVPQEDKSELQEYNFNTLLLSTYIWRQCNEMIPLEEYNIKSMTRTHIPRQIPLSQLSFRVQTRLG